MAETTKTKSASVLEDKVQLSTAILREYDILLEKMTLDEGRTRSGMIQQLIRDGAKKRKVTASMEDVDLYSPTDRRPAR